MKIVVDALGGDKNFPAINVEGALLALKDYSDVEVILVGPKEEIEKEIFKNRKFFKEITKRISIINATECVTMEDQPSKIIRTKENSSIGVGLKLLRDGLADAFVSSGNSGAILAFSITYIKKIPHIDRPAIATVLPTINKPCVVIDVGANVDCKPKQLLEFGYMGSIYCRKILNIENPRVALLSIGTEESKGNLQVLEAYQLFKSSKLNFIGNIEGRDIPFGVADVVVSDGFVGNVVLKLGEGIAEVLLELIKYSLKKHPFSWFALPFVWNAIRDLRRKIDFTEYGGAPLLGLEKVCVICHGRSNAKAIKNAIKVAKQMVEEKISFVISEFMDNIINEKS